VNIKALGIDWFRKGSSLDTGVPAPIGNENQANSSYEVEFALVLARMIDASHADPAQLRSNIYELARVKLRREILRGDLAGDRRLVNALEDAIQGVETFAKREDDLSRSSLPRVVPLHITKQTASAQSATLIEHASEQTVGRNLSEGPDIPNIRGTILRFGLVLALITVGIAIFALVRPYKSGRQQSEQSNAVTINKSSLPETATGQPSVVSSPPAAVAVSSPPLPTVYGVYALNNGQFEEVYSLPGRIPDKRVAISAAIGIPSRTMLENGNISFLIFRRDLLTSAPEYAEVRIVAKITRAMAFDSSGKPSITSVGDSWSVRNISYPLRVAPISVNPEMMALKSEDPDFALPPGRYAVVIKGQGYDFTIAGPITDPRQCLEKVEAVNGSFYAECRKP
jgi:hypothetical protein